MLLSNFLHHRIQDRSFPIDRMCRVLIPPFEIENIKERVNNMSDEIKKEFGKKVKYYRELRGLTQEALAEKLDVNVNSMSYIERGINFIKSDTLDKLCRVLDVTPKQLFDFNYNTQPDVNIKEALITLLNQNEEKLNDVYKIVNGFLS